MVARLGADRRTSSRSWLQWKTDATFIRPSFRVIEPVRSFDNASPTDWTAHRMVPELEVYTDGLARFRRQEEVGHAHTTLDTGGRSATTEVAGARRVNVVRCNLKRVISGVHHAFAQGKYTRRYLAPAAYRLNRRFRLPKMLPLLAMAIMRCSSVRSDALQSCLKPARRMTSNFHG